MLKFITKLVFAMSFFSLITACTHSFTKEDQVPQEVKPQAEQEITPASTWEDAYGEAQDSEVNKLAAVPPVDVGVEPETKDMTPMPITDLWQRTRNGFAIPSPANQPKIERQLNWFVKHPDYINRVVERARPYLHYIVDELEQRKMPLEIALLPVVESGFQPFAYSNGRAAGLWQFIPGTGKLYGLQQDWWYDGRRDVIESTRAALDYLEKLHNDFGDWQLALAAYNCGEGTVSRAIKHNLKLGKPTDFWSLDLPKETSAYVPKLLAISQLVKNPEKYQITLKPIDNSPFLTVVDVGSQIDLALAAKLADMTTDEIYQLNPGFNRWATRPNGSHKLVVPFEKAIQFQQALNDLPMNKRVQWTRHKIKNGESLGGIAKHYKTTIAVIKQANGLVGNTIRAGHHLLIPIASGKASSYPLTQSQRLATRQNRPRKGNKIIHTVKAGDTWWDIAKAHHVAVKKLTHWNGKAPGDTLHLGQKLVVWTKGVKSSRSKTVRTISYKIRSGDSLWKIANRFKVSVADVREWNSLSERTLLKPGQNLTLHIDVTQQHDSI